LVCLGRSIRRRGDYGKTITGFRARRTVDHASSAGGITGLQR
jgi:hypothetical protein